MAPRPKPARQDDVVVTVDGVTVTLSATRPEGTSRAKVDAAVREATKRLAERMAR